MGNQLKFKNIFLVLSLMFACSQTFAKYVVIEPEQTIEVVFVVGDSGSMGMFQRILAYNISTILNTLTNKGKIVKVGLLNTSQSDQRKPDGKFKLSVKNPGMSKIDQLSQSLMSFGTSGDATETFFPNLIASFDEPENKGFYNSDDLLYIVILSDSYDQSSIDEQTFLASLKRLKSDLSLVKLYGIFALTDPAKGITDCKGEEKPPTKVLNLVENYALLDGKIYSICESDWKNIKLD